MYKILKPSQQWDGSRNVVDKATLMQKNSCTVRNERISRRYETLGIRHCKVQTLTIWCKFLLILEKKSSVFQLSCVTSHIWGSDCSRDNDDVPVLGCCVDFWYITLVSTYKPRQNHITEEQDHHSICWLF